MASFAITTAIGFPIALRNSIRTPSGPSAFPDFCLFIAWRASGSITLRGNRSIYSGNVSLSKLVSVISLKSAWEPR